MSFKDICAALAEFYPLIAANHDGHNASYIPELACVNPELFGIAVCSCNGETWSMGDCEIPFTFQSTVKPLLYNVALGLVGEEEVHRHIGYEPSGRRFNAFVMDDDNKPHNPFINAGAIMASAIIRSRQPSQVEAFKSVKSFAERCSGFAYPVTFDNSVFLSELGTAERNFALTYFMRECSSFLQSVPIERTLELYFSACSMSINCKGLAAVAATYASGGVCPLTREVVMDPKAAKNTMQLMFNCGMYDYSGRFAFEVGIPAKSGVSGALFMCVPGRFGIGIWSPPLDKHGNTVRGLQVAKMLVERFPDLHIFGQALKRAEKAMQQELARNAITNGQVLIHAASVGNLELVKEMVEVTKVDVNTADYDGRTPLHLAFAERHVDVAIYLIQNGADINFKDRFGSTPRSEAANHNLADVIPEALGISRPPSPTLDRAAISTNRSRSASGGSTTVTSAAVAMGSNGKPLPRLTVTADIPPLAESTSVPLPVANGKNAKTEVKGNKDAVHGTTAAPPSAPPTAGAKVLL